MAPGAAKVKQHIAEEREEFNSEMFQWPTTRAGARNERHVIIRI
jgi:hypothetical protein